MPGPRLSVSVLCLAVFLAVTTSPLAAQDKALRGFDIKVIAQASGEERDLIVALPGEDQNNNGQLDENEDANGNGKLDTAEVGLWVLEVRFKPLRMVSLELTDPKTGKKSKQLVWYLVYRAVNRPLPPLPDESRSGPINPFDRSPGRPLFVPEFTLVTNDNKKQVQYVDQILPEAQAAIAVRERLPQLKNSIQVVGPIPQPTPVSAKQDINPIYGVATWKGINPDTDHVTLYMSGFSNGYRHVHDRRFSFVELTQLRNQNKIRSSTAIWNGELGARWTNVPDTRQLIDDGKADLQKIAKTQWLLAVDPSIAGPPAQTSLWRKTLMQQYWRPGDRFDQEEGEFLLKGPNDEVYEPRWIYRIEKAAAKVPAAAAAPAGSPEPRPN